ncbi:hypothetical protein D3C87_1208830 [compost metagenome]
MASKVNRLFQSPASNPASVEVIRSGFKLGSYVVFPAVNPDTEPKGNPLVAGCENVAAKKYGSISEFAVLVHPPLTFK